MEVLEFSARIFFLCALSVVSRVTAVENDTLAITFYNLLAMFFFAILYKRPNILSL